MKRLIILGLVTFLLILFLTFPARVAYELFSPPELQLSGISGSIWNGDATEGMAGGAYVRDISWRVIPESLLSGQLAFATRCSPMSGRLDAEVAVGTDGTLALSGIRGNVPLDLVHPALQENGIRGDVRLDFDSVVIRGALPVYASGSVTVNDFQARSLLPERLGDFRAEFHGAADGIAATVSDLDGLLNLDGSLTVASDGTFAFVGEVSPVENAPEALVNQLRFLGSRNERGMHEFRFEGHL